MSAPGGPQCQCAHPYYCRCQFSRWGVPIHASLPNFHLNQYYPSTQYSATATYPTTHTPISASNFASGPPQLPQINSVPFPLANATASTLNTDNPSPSQPRKRQRVNATSSSDRSKKKTRTSVTVATNISATAPTITSSVVGVGPSLETQSLSEAVPNPTYAAIEKVVGKVKNKADRHVMALDVWHFVTPMDSADEPLEMAAVATPSLNTPLITQKPTSPYLGCRLCP